jgi:drug/metabolite transporter (DMT)-like permease
LIVAYFFFGQPIALDKFFYILAGAGIIDIIGYIYFYRGLSVGLVGVVSPISAMFAAITVLLSVLILGESITALQVFSIILIVTGCFLVSTDIREFLKFKSSKLAEGVKEGLIAMVSWGIMATFIALAVREVGWFMPILVMRVFVIFPFLIFAKVKKIPLKFTSNKTLVALIAFMAILDIAGFVAFNMGVSGSQAAIVAPVSAAYPLISIFLAYFFLKERMVLNQYVGAGIAIAGLVMLSII